ncbi:ribbon-helix-helix protein, CopG family [Pseudothauera nasutitermitis]|uniref:Ribbon-helix-helix protein, CopG family n=1 Tax=Pseudothauera nasutitermitis TaxID=2565930 RepID=A0A4S4AR71_9RHOO|nr:ribbon-helix-helix protein, CopG family [Pseudothauera nasutitermitis]THF62301.1 ribbon-helix-helix protein, CopG family [Pseudothauera nasutitermitis]
MTLSIRLDPELEAELARAAAQTGRSKSELVKAGLREYLARVVPKKTPYELGKDLFGDGEGGSADFSGKETTRRIIVERLRAENDR